MNSVVNKHYGAVTVEFALVVPLLVMLVFGITEIGRALFQLNTLTKSTEAGARYLSRIHGAVNIVDELSGDYCTQGDAWTSDNLSKAESLVVYGNETGGGEPLIPGLTVQSIDVGEVQLTEGASSTVGCVITVTSEAIYTSAFGDEGPIIPFTDIDTFTMTQTVQERYIGE